MPGGTTATGPLTGVDINVGPSRPNGYSGTGDPGFGRPGRVRGPRFVLLGHELCGHGVSGHGQVQGAVDIENDIRTEHGVPGTRDGYDH